MRSICPFQSLKNVLRRKNFFIHSFKTNVCLDVKGSMKLIIPVNIEILHSLNGYR